MTEDEKPHWIKLKEVVRTFGNGEVVVKFQDELPVLIVEIRGEKNNIDLTKTKV